MDSSPVLPVRKRQYRRQGGVTPIEQRPQRLKAIAESAMLFASCQELSAALDCVARQVARLFGGICTVQLTLDDSRGLPMRACVDPSEIGLPSASAETQPGATILSAPLLAQGRSIGMIDVVLSGPPERITAAEHQFLQDLAGHGALAINNAYCYTRQQYALHEAQSAGAGQSPDRLLGLLVQDLKGPLGEIKASLLVLYRTIGGAKKVDVAQATRQLRTAEAALARMETQIGSLLGTSTVAPQSKAQPEPLDLVALTRLLANFYQETTARHKLLVAVGDGALVGHWPRPQIEQAIGNLLANAIKYSPSGGTIQVSLSREESEGVAWAMLIVSDKGIGIPGSDLPHISERRYRANNVGAIPGTGLGLASVREIVAQQGGTFSMASVPGAGTTVTVRLPLPDVR